MSKWIKRKVLITVKAYPTPSNKYVETVCVAGITEEEGWIRLYPINYRSLEEEYKFEKYDVVEMEIQKHPQDSRPESYEPKIESIKIIKKIDSKKNWARRKEFIFPTRSNSMCEIQRLQESQNKSLGTFKVREVDDFLVEESEGPDADYSYPAQLSFYNRSIQKLERIPFKFRLKYFCNDPDCRGHRQEILDWEIGELYRKLKNTTSDKSIIIDKIKVKYLNEVCNEQNDLHLFVGNHSRHQNSFMILGMFWPKKEKQKSWLY